MYNKKGYNRTYMGSSDEPKQIDLIYEKFWLHLTGSEKPSFQLSCVYNHQISQNLSDSKSYSLDKIKKFHLEEVFIPHVCQSDPTTRDGAWYPSWKVSEEIAYQYGFYAAAFFYALDIKDPVLKLFNDEWIVIDSKLGNFDFISYFSYNKVIPVKLPFPGVSNSTDAEFFKSFK